MCDAANIHLDYKKISEICKYSELAKSNLEDILDKFHTHVTDNYAKNICALLRHFKEKFELALTISNNTLFIERAYIIILNFNDVIYVLGHDKNISNTDNIKSFKNFIYTLFTGYDMHTAIYSKEAILQSIELM